MGRSEVNNKVYKYLETLNPNIKSSEDLSHDSVQVCINSLSDKVGNYYRSSLTAITKPTGERRASMWPHAHFDKATAPQKALAVAVAAGVIALDVRDDEVKPKSKWLLNDSDLEVIQNIKVG